MGFNPTKPHKLAGCLIEPPVSVPIDATQEPSATAAADPPEEPPGTSFSDGLFLFCQGLTTGPKWLVSFHEPIANSSQLFLPIKIAPSLSNCWVTKDSY